MKKISKGIRWILACVLSWLGLGSTAARADDDFDQKRNQYATEGDDDGFDDDFNDSIGDEFLKPTNDGAPQQSGN